MFQKITRIFGGNPHKREVEELSKTVQEINSLEKEYEALSDDQLRAKTDEFRSRIAEIIGEVEDEKERANLEQDALKQVLSEAFAVVREAAKRSIGLRHYDVQMVGGMALHSGKIAEMRTGEGKTLVATLPLYLNALLGRGTHLVTVNDYLARRDARWMGPIFQILGMSVGVLQMASRTENGRKAFLVDLDKTSPKEDQNQLALVDRREAYLADVTYGTNSEFGFDYLRDNLTFSMAERVQRGHYYTIVDEVDNILIDEARTPLIISGPASEDVNLYATMSNVVRQLVDEDYEVSEKDRAVSLTELGEVHVEALLGQSLRDPDRPEDVNPEQARLMGYLEQALRAQFLYHKNKEYLVQSGKVVIVDEFTGRLMPGRRWSDGLHQAVEAKENVRVEPENVTYATITIQNYFRMYQKLAGMTGTALTEAEEFFKIYKLDVLPIPTNLEYTAEVTGAELVQFDGKDEQNYKFTAYARRNDPTRQPVYWKRKDFPDVVFRSEEAKVRQITTEIIHYHITGRPQLVGTTSVEHSERLSDRLAAEPIRRLLQVKLVREVYLQKKNIQMVERAIPELAPLNKPIPELEIGEIRNLVRSLNLGIQLSLEEPENLDRLCQILELKEVDKPRLVKVLQGGTPHQVLNARKHDEESMIIARAGAFGQVTIATNMAGRGVDIKLGGELPEDALADVVRVLNGAGYPDAFEMSNEERRQALLKLTSDDIGIYEEAVRVFLQYLEDMKKVRELGGLHVIGSERHEARRIDNQLRGRAARQGDPGSSRFYLSLQDDLMRLFGGGQAEGLYKRLNIDENLPVESGIIGRLVEQSQERVEGSNFDVRKHLLEYDDVLNSQRKRIYEQRDRVMTKDDLREDLEDLLRTELEKRIPESLKDEEGPWKLLAYLEDIQPAISFDDMFYPSYTLRLLLDEVARRLPKQGLAGQRVRNALLDIAGDALESEKEHALRATRTMLEKTSESIEQQKSERVDALDGFFEGLRSTEDEEGAPSLPKRPMELLEELSGLARVQFRLSPEQLRRLPQGDADIKDYLRSQVETGLLALAAGRLVGAIEHRLQESTGLKPAGLASLTFDELGDQIMQAVEKIFDNRKSRLLGETGQLANDLEPALDRMGQAALEDDNVLSLMNTMVYGQRMAFDRKTHRQGWQRYERISYTYLAARLLENMSSEQVTADVLEHLQGARQALHEVWGQSEWRRLAQNDVTFRKFDERAQDIFRDTLGAERFEEIAELPFSSFTAADAALTAQALGRRTQNEITRQLLLNVISDQWVEYLTKVEGLRVSIGLEAYAQRNPLVEYKGRASEMFRQLLVDVRAAVISRLFTYQPARTAEAAVERPAERAEPSEKAQPVQSQQAQSAFPARQDSRPSDGRKKKHKRH